VNARIEEFDLKGAVFDWTLLPYELIKPRLANLTNTIGGGIGSTIVTWRGAVQRHLESNGFTALGRTQHEI
jgi:hypothetical protein